VAFYDRIAKKWHTVTGAQGGPLKRLVLNDFVLSRVPGIAGRAILELGAGNGYFMPLLIRRFSGQVSSRVVITDHSPVLLNLAQRYFRVPNAEYKLLDVRSHYPFDDGAFHVVIANMVFNEVKAVGLKRAASECYRVLAPGGCVIGTVTHPNFVNSLSARGLLRRGPGGSLSMPGSDGLRLPVVRRSLQEYLAAFQDAGFECRTEDIFAIPEVFHDKPGLKEVRDIPIALLLQANKGQPLLSEQTTPSVDQTREWSLMTLQPGVEVVPGYVLAARLGRGGFGEVWRAVGPGTVPVALKLLRVEERVAAVEARALEFMKLVRHPHLLSTFGIWHEQDLLIVGMELADCSLMDCWREASSTGLPGIGFAQLIEYLSEAAKGIDYLNEPRHTLKDREKVRIVHRDIKPHNLLLVGGAVKIGDFGLARIVERSTAGSSSGALTPAYAAPEFFQGCVTRYSDQYSLAVSYCQLRGGRLPFSGSFHEIMAGHLGQEPDLTMIPTREHHTVARALAKQPQERWPNCQAFVRALAEIGEP
jgi:SAM-dependent methyltransferase